MASKGFTLIQQVSLLAVLLSVVFILAPLISSYIDQSRATRAAAEVRTIAHAARLYKRDTGQFPIYANDTDSKTDAQSVTDLVSIGNTPSHFGGGSGWEFNSNGEMETFINTNLLQLPTTSPRGEWVAYLGPYLSAINEDPWGNAYVITASNLLRSSPNIGFVISAGPNGVLDTNRDQDGSLTVKDDDIAVRIK